MSRAAIWPVLPCSSLVRERYEFDVGEEPDALAVMLDGRAIAFTFGS
jgi:hypothetical protein